MTNKERAGLVSFALLMESVVAGVLAFSLYLHLPWLDPFAGVLITFVLPWVGAMTAIFILKD